MCSTVIDASDGSMLHSKPSAFLARKFIQRYAGHACTYLNYFFLALSNSNYNLASAQSVPRLASLAAAIHALGKLYQNQDNLPADKIFYVIELAKLTSANKKKTIEKKQKCGF